MTPTPVTVVGLGPMGRAMAGAFLEAGHPTTVFNRTPGKDDELVRTGARRADSADAALAASDLIVLSLTHYQAMYDLLGSATDGLAGKTLVNLSSDTPRESERASAWAGEHGADFLTGGIMVPAELVGQEGAYTFY
ncbi:MAG: NAD(P)-binding domain-containing protein, partial [Actinomycetia bacterium]|nr:NAD(P)-binding domain-containing protein [Actinomycetes bacterium]